MKKISKKGKQQIKKDEKTYEAVWDSKPHNCEECGKFLGDDFRNYEGRINNKSYYSHILTKARHPNFRNNIKNFNLLCPTCHQKWEFGNRVDMEITPDNKIIIQKLLEGDLDTDELILLYDFYMFARNPFMTKKASKILLELKKVLSQPNFEYLEGGWTNNDIENVYRNLVNILKNN